MEREGEIEREGGRVCERDGACMSGAGGLGEYGKERVGKSRREQRS